MSSIVLRQRPHAPLLAHAFLDALMAPSRAAGHGMPMELFETPDAFSLRAALPGFSKEQVSVEIDKASVSISARRDEQPLAQGATALMRSPTFAALNMQSSLELPHPVDAEAVRASFANGVLELTLPKIVPAKRSVQID